MIPPTSEEMEELVDNDCDGCDDCDDARREDDFCDECCMWGDYQCSAHGAAVIEAMRQEDHRCRAIAAMETLRELHDVWHGAAWQRLQRDLGRVLGEMGDDR